MEKWIEVARSEQIKENKGWPLQIAGKKIVIFRHQGALFAMKNACPHQGAPLSHGFVGDGQVTCVYHGWKFMLSDGRFVGNEKLKIKTYSIKEQDGKIFLNTSEI